MKINKHILPNGLRLVHYQDLSTQMVALNIVYDVGARDEDPEHTGFANLVDTNYCTLKSIFFDILCIFVAYFFNSEEMYFAIWRSFYYS